MAEEEVGLRLSLKNRRETVAGLDDVGDKLDRAGDEASSAGRKARIAAGGMLAFGKSGKVAGRAVVYGMGAAAAGVVGAGIVLSKLAKDSVGEAREAQKVGAVTRQQIKATGQAANVTAKQVGNLSSAISKKVGIDDEEIQSSANLVLAYKNVANQQGKGNKIYDRSIRAAVDMAAVTGSLTSNSKLLGKNLNDPLKAITGLGKAGVKWTDQQIKQIQNDVKQNDLLGAQKIILGEVEDRVGGVAAKQATWGEKASVSIGNIKEDIGTALLPALDATEKWFVQKGSPVLEHYVGIFENKGIPAIGRYADLFRDKGIPAIHDFLEDARPLAKSILPAIGTGLETTADAFKIIAPRAKAVFDGFNDLPDWAKSAIAITAGAGVVGKKLGLGSLLTGGKGGSIFSAGSTPANAMWVRVVNGTLPTTKPTPVPTPPGGEGRPSPLTIGTMALSLGLGAATLGGAVDAPGDKWYQNGLKAVDTKDVGSEAEAEKYFFDQRTKAFKEWVDTQTVGYAASSKALGHLISGTGQLDSSVGKAKTSTQQLLNVLTGTDRNFSPSITVDGLGTALLRVDSFQSKLEQLGNTGVGLPGRAAGGPLRAGQAAIVGEKGPELYVPKVDGHVRTNAELRRLMSESSPSHDFDDMEAGPGQPIHVHVNVDGREMAEVVLNGLGGIQARR